MTTDTTDWSDYRSLGQSPTARTALRVSQSLISLANPSAKDATKRNLARLKERSEKLQRALDRRGIPGPEKPDTQAVDMKADRAWGAAELRLRAWEGLADSLGEDHPKVSRARELRAALFAEGTAFLKLTYAEQDVEMERLLRLIDSESLERDLVSLVGREFVDAIKSAQPEYHAMVSSMLARDDQKERVVTLVRATIVAIEQYAMSVIGAVDYEDSASVDAARKLLAPIANQRRTQAPADSASDPTPPAPAG